MFFINNLSVSRHDYSTYPFHLQTLTYNENVNLSQNINGAEGIMGSTGPQKGKEVPSLPSSVRPIEKNR